MFLRQREKIRVDVSFFSFQAAFLLSVVCIFHVYFAKRICLSPGDRTLKVVCCSYSLGKKEHGISEKNRYSVLFCEEKIRGYPISPQNFRYISFSDMRYFLGVRAIAASEIFQNSFCYRNADLINIIDNELRILGIIVECYLHQYGRCFGAPQLVVTLAVKCGIAFLDAKTLCGEIACS